MVELLLDVVGAGVLELLLDVVGAGCGYHINMYGALGDQDVWCVR